MKNLLFLLNALQRSVLCFMLLTSAFAISFTSCSDDDEDIPQGGEIDFGVPPSVVDGVRPTEASGVKSVIMKMAPFVMPKLTVAHLHLIMLLHGLLVPVS